MRIRTPTPSELRHEALRRLDQSPPPCEPHPHRLVHELQVHQIELEMQNDELRRTQLEIEAGRERYADLYDFSPVGYFSLDAMGTILQANLTAAKLLGVPRGELLGLQLLAFVDETDQPLANACLEKVLAQRTQESAEVKLFTQEADPRYVRFEVTLAREARVCHAVMIDITERRLAVEALQGAKLAAERATEIKDQFLARLSHELRTPLTPVLLAAKHWQNQPHLAPDLHDDLTMTCRNLELEIRLVDDLLDLNRILHGKVTLRRETLPIHPIIREALENLAASVQAKKLNLKLDLAAACDQIDGDSVRMQQIFWNLLSNACKFTPESGQITLRTTNDPAGIRIDIIDTGKGIDADVLPRIFNSFEQGDPQTNRLYGGLGIGLSICKSMVEAHGGSIAAQSPGPGMGTTFVLHFPLAPQSLEALPQAPVSAVAGRQRKSKILLVEDHADTAMILSRLLRGEGYRVETVGTVAKALTSLAHGRFHLLLSDLGLPDASGLYLMRQVVASGHPIHAIALSGYGSEEDRARSLQAGFKEHLTKPTNLPLLLRTIDALLPP